MSARGLDHLHRRHTLLRDLLDLLLASRRKAGGDHRHAQRVAQALVVGGTVDDMGFFGCVLVLVLCHPLRWLALLVPTPFASLARRLGSVR